MCLPHAPVQFETLDSDLDWTELGWIGLGIGQGQDTVFMYSYRRHLESLKPLVMPVASTPSSSTWFPVSLDVSPVSGASRSAEGLPRLS